MPKTISLRNMSAKYLVDYVSAVGWATSPEDTYRAGKLLAVILPRFGDGEGEIKLLTPPSAPGKLLPSGETDWSSMSREEAESYRRSILQHNRDFVAWSRTKVPEFELTDKQVATCQKALKYFSPRTAEEREKDNSRGERPVMPNNEFTYELLGALGMGDE